MKYKKKIENAQQHVCEGSSGDVAKSGVKIENAQQHVCEESSGNIAKSGVKIENAQQLVCEGSSGDVVKSGVKEKLILIFSGIATGFANGFFGGGGGMITVPVLAKLLKYEEKKAHATALLVILPISIFSSISYIVKGSIDFSTAGFVAIGVVAGGIVGAIFLKKISNKVLTYLFAVIMIVVGVKMFL